MQPIICQLPITPELWISSNHAIKFIKLLKLFKAVYQEKILVVFSPLQFQEKPQTSDDLQSNVQSIITALPLVQCYAPFNEQKLKQLMIETIDEAELLPLNDGETLYNAIHKYNNTRIKMDHSLHDEPIYMLFDLNIDFPLSSFSAPINEKQILTLNKLGVESKFDFEDLKHPFLFINKMKQVLNDKQFSELMSWIVFYEETYHNLSRNSMEDLVFKSCGGFTTQTKIKINEVLSEEADLWSLNRKRYKYWDTEDLLGEWLLG